jgi:hypothetical protein
VRNVAPPSGDAPPHQVRLRAGGAITLAPPAAKASDRHLAAHPAELERYGPRASDWCANDLQWLLAWAVMHADGQAIDFDAQLDWLARVLAARGYPLASLADALDTLADEIAPTFAAAAVTLRAGGRRVRP